MKWLRIPGATRYEVSDAGCVRRAERVGNWAPAPCAEWVNNRGYQMVDLTQDNGVAKAFSVHRLVLLAFVGPPTQGLQVRHLDGCKANNRLENLRYGTASENAADRVSHGTHLEGEAINTAKLNSQTVLAIVEALTVGGSYPEIAAKFNTSKSIVAAIARGETWKHVTGGVDRRNGSKFACRGGQAWSRIRSMAEGANA